MPRLVATLLGTLTQSTDAADLAANWQRLAEHFDTLFTTESSLDALKQTILQLAVMGKLVPQDPNDEPASELLKRIAKERARLEAERNLRRNRSRCRQWVRLNSRYQVGIGSDSEHGSVTVGSCWSACKTAAVLAQPAIKFRSSKQYCSGAHFDSDAIRHTSPKSPLQALK